MKTSFVCMSLLVGVFTGGIFLPANAQVTSDGTTNTTVNTNGNNFTILNGIEKGNNLFHSFSNFSVPTGGSAKFDLVNTPNITTIFSRVTGGNISNIDGLIQTLNGNNPASLFLMNPNGIVFGENASLNIGGSFVGTTANSIKFSDGTEFSTVNPSQPPLLTMSVPVGLQMGSNPGNIQVNDAGQKGFDLPGIFSPILAPGVESLQVETGQTLALIGGNIDLTGGLLAAPQGRIELGSVAANTFVGLQTVERGYALNYTNVENFGDIRITQASSVDASGNGGGNIQIQGRQVRVSDGTFVLGNTKGSDNGGTVIVRASDLLEVIGGSGVSRITSSVAPQATGDGGQVIVEADRLRQIDAGQIGAGTFGSGNAGSVTVRARDIELSGALGRFPTNITSPTGFGLNNPIGQRIKDTSTGNSGNILIEADRLRLLNGAQISAITFIQGNAGKIEIAAEQMEILGINEETKSISGVFTTVNPGAVGQGGDIVLNVDRLLVAEGGEISSSSKGIGNAGNVEIRAKEIDIREVSPLDNQFVSRIGSQVVSDAVGDGGSIFIEANGLRVVDGGQISASTEGGGVAGSIDIRARDFDIEGVSSQGLFPSQVTAFASSDFNAGSITIATKHLNVRNNAEITASNIGGGNAGNLNVTSGNIFLDNGSSLQAQVNGGNQGNINLNVADTLVLRRGSFIEANATGTSTGGNITINSPVIAGFENSDIIANAVEGNGGNINITTQGIFGLEFRDQLTEESDITASSEFGVNGTVEINNFGIDPSSGILELPVTTTDKSQQIARGCADTSGSSFIATGRGGIPTNPNQDIRSDRTWSDVRDISAYRQDKPVTAQIPAPAKTIIQATGWRRNADGKVELIAKNPTNSVQQNLTCAALPQS